MVLELKNIVKKFDKRIALNSVDLLVENSPFLCIMGKHSSGKSTLLRVIAGIIEADDGEININENNIFSSLEHRKNIFYVSDNPLYMQDETIDHAIKIYKNFYKDFNVGFAKSQSEIYFGSISIKISEMSLEDRKVLSIILAIASEAKYVLLDETLDNIDKTKKEALFDLILEENKNRGLSLIFTTQNINEVVKIATDIIILENGSVIYYENLEVASFHKCKLQYMDKSLRSPEELFGNFRIVNSFSSGKVYIVILADTKHNVEEYLKNLNLEYYEFLKIDINDILYDIPEIK